MNREEAREIVAEWRTYESALSRQGTLRNDEENGVDWFPKSGDLERYRAEGYLAALEGPEVSKLVEALEKLLGGIECKPGCEGYDWCVCEENFIRQALSCEEGKCE